MNSFTSSDVAEKIDGDGSTAMTSTTPAPGRLIVVSNRLPFVLKMNANTQKWERVASASGLVSAVAPVVNKGNGLWIGWAGVHLDKNDIIPESDPDDTTPTAGLRSDRVIPVDFDPPTFDSYYNGCCNGTLWPLFHSMPDRAEFSAESWRSYCTINEEFASKTIGALKSLSKEDTDRGIPIVWLHDYHLMLAANSIRNAAEKMDLKFKLGFFLHVPFPPWDIFRLFPWADQILQGMLGCDMISFHIEDYCLNFLDCCWRSIGCHVDRNKFLIEYGNRTVRIRAMPIGIPFDRYVEMAHEAPTVIRTALQVVLGVDRLDYTKGLVHRLKAFELLLERYPEHLGKVALMQIAVPSRTNIKEYQDLKEEMDQLVGRINGRFSTPNWSPIRYIYGSVNQNVLAAFYRDSVVAMVTPLRDGMNLVAKEFVACQIKDIPGVLIVSPFAGTGETMHEALICNPYELTESADTIHRALTMSGDERVLRMGSLRRREQKNDVNFWMRSFLEAMATLISEDGGEVIPTTMQPVTFQDFDDYLSKYIGNTNKLALLLDYDGTLAPLALHPDLAILPSETKSVLERLAVIPGLYISIISGRSVDNVKNMVGIEGLTYAGHHGMEILHPDGTQFSILQDPVQIMYVEKINSLLKELQDQVCRYGAWVENKDVLLTFHYREVPVEAQLELVATAERLIIEAGFRAVPAHCAIEAKPPVQWDKGRASMYIIRNDFGLDWKERIRVVYAGDDVTDEDAMQALKGMAATFRVTHSQIIKTSAEWRLPNTESVLTMLKWIEKHFKERVYSEESSSNSL